jgi:RNA polymerase sigma-70 factor (ECF subfamily)
MSQNPHFEDLHKKFSTPLFRFIAKRIGAKPEVTEEVFEETVVAAWKGFKTFKYKSTYFTWLCRIALNKIADYYRDQIHERSHIIVPTLKAMSLIEAGDISPEERLVLNDLRDNVNACLNLLPTNVRKLLWYRYWRGMSYDQIAKVMDISVRAVEGRLYRAKESFAKVWTTKL